MINSKNIQLCLPFKQPTKQTNDENRHSKTTAIPKEVPVVQLFMDDGAALLLISPNYPLRFTYCRFPVIEVITCSCFKLIL